MGPKTFPLRIINLLKPRDTYIHFSLTSINLLNPPDSYSWNVLLDVWAPSCWFELLSVVPSVMLWFWPQPSSPWLSVSRLSGLARHDTKYKQKYHSKCKSFLYEREIAALNLAWVVVSGWGMELRPQIILQRKQTTQTLLNENVIKSYLKTYW